MYMWIWIHIYIYRERERVPKKCRPFGPQVGFKDAGSNCPRPLFSYEVFCVLNMIKNAKG